MEPKSVEIAFSLNFDNEIKKTAEKNKHFHITNPVISNLFKKKILDKVYDPFIINEEKKGISSRTVSIPFTKLSYWIGSSYLNINMNINVNKIKETVLDSKNPLFIAMLKYYPVLKHFMVTYNGCEEETLSELINDLKISSGIEEIDFDKSKNIAMREYLVKERICNKKGDGVKVYQSKDDYYLCTHYNANQKVAKIMVKCDKKGKDNDARSRQLDIANSVVVSVINGIKDAA